MFQIFKRKPGKEETSVAARTATPSETSKDVVNLLIPTTVYNQKTGVSNLLQIMAGKKRRGKRKRSESCRISPTKDFNIQRTQSVKIDAPRVDENSAVNEQAEFVKAIVLQKYAKTPPQSHVCKLYVPNDNIDEKKHAEALLREIAKTIDCAVDEIEMGGADSKHKEPLYETIDNRQINNYKKDLKQELERLQPKNDEKSKTFDDKAKSVNDIAKSVDNTANSEYDTAKSVDKSMSLDKVMSVDVTSDSLNIELKSEGDSPNVSKKSNLKLPKSENEACSDDDRSDNGKKKVTFRKHIIFDDGEQQTDEEIDSTFESLSSEEENEYLEDSIDNKTVININEDKIQIKIENCDQNFENQNLNLANFDNSQQFDGQNLAQNSFENSSKNLASGVQKLESDFGNSDQFFKIDNDDQKMLSDCSDSGFLDIGDKDMTVKSGESESDSGSETEEEIIEEIIEEEISFAEEFEDDEEEEEKSIVSHDNQFQSQVEALTELGDARGESVERTRDLLAACRKELQAKDQEIEQLKCELAAAYKESELIRQRSRSLEEELGAARRCSAGLADQLRARNEECMRELKAEIEQAAARRTELEARVAALERDRDRLEGEKAAQEQKAQQALETAEANTAKWRLAHESARSQAAARAERMLADCEWKMREIEKKAREADKENRQLKQSLEQLTSNPPLPASHVAELSQLRGFASEQQRSVQSLTLQLQKVETREEALKLEVHRLKELLEREVTSGREKEERHAQKVESLERTHSDALETLRSSLTSTFAASRSALERAHAERTRAALAQLREESEQQARNADRKIREITTRFENLKEELSTKESQFETAITEAHSKADWDILQLRHLLDKADIDYANNVENLNRKFEEEKEKLIEEWSSKLEEVEERAAAEVEEARGLLDETRLKMMAERLDQVNKLKDQHRREMDDQWEQFMTDKENCLARMKTECRQEGEEERVKREKELLEEIAELKSQINSKSNDFDTLAVRAAACGRTLAVTEQELREALAREREMREKRSEDGTKIKQLEKNSKEQVEHLTRKCACLRKLFDDMRGRLTAKERVAEQEARARDKELHQLRGEVARLTKILVEQSSPKLGARTRADGCEMVQLSEVPRRKGSHRTPELVRKRTCPLPIDLALKHNGAQDGRPRAKSVDLPAVQVPIIVKQLERKKEC